MNDSQHYKKQKHYGYYRITVSADTKNAFVEAKFSAKNDDGVWVEKSVQKKRISQEIIVRDYTVQETGDKKDIDGKNKRITIDAEEIIDTVDHSSLGNRVEFWSPPDYSDDTTGTTSNEGKDIKAVSKKEKPERTISFSAIAIDPPQWIPLKNDDYLLIKFPTRDLKVQITDRRLGEIVYETDVVEIRGVDIRVYGREIKYREYSKASGDEISSCKAKTFHFWGGDIIWRKKSETMGDIIRLREITLSSNNGKHILVVKGGQLQVAGVRISDAEKMSISLEDVGRLNELEIEVLPCHNDSSQGRGAAEVKWHETGTLSLLCLIGLVIILGVLSVLPCCYFSGSGKRDGINSDCITNRVPVSVAKDNNLMPSAVNMQVPRMTSFTIQTVGAGVTSNQFHVAVSGENSITNVPAISDDLCNSGKSSLWGQFLAIILYAAFYCVVVYLTIKVYHAFNRQRRLTGDMSGVLEALRNERDKDKRRAMQKKILDDMIDTYLDKPSSED